MNSPQNPLKPAIRATNLPAFLICSVIFIFWITLLTCKYLNFGYDDWDLAFFSQGIWNLAHGQQYVSVFDMNLFGNHSNIIAYLCLPIYALFQHPLTLVFLKLLSFITSGYIFCILAEREVGKTAAITLMLIYFIYPPSVFAVLYEFDWESLSPFFLMCLYYSFQKNKFFIFLIISLLTVLIKENMPLIVAAFGIFGFFAKDRNKVLWGAVPFLVGLISFYLLTTVFIPNFREGASHMYLGYYKGLGNSPLSIITHIILHPWEIISHITTTENKKYLFELFGPVLYLPLANPQIIFLITPILLQHILSQAYTEHLIYFQYGITIAPFLFIALYKTFSFLKNHLSRLTTNIILVLIFILNVYSLYSHQDVLKSRAALNPSPLNSFEWEFVKNIPKGEGVVATLSYLAELSSRKELYAFHKVYTDVFQPFAVPENVQYALIDFKNPWLQSKFNYDAAETVKRIQKFYFDQNWILLKSAENIVLLKKGKGEGLVQWETNAEASYHKKILSIEDQFSLAESQGPSGSIAPGSLLPLTFAWISYADINEQYKMVISLIKNKKVVAQSVREIGYKIYPTFVWRKNDIIREKYNFFVPNITPGNYQLAVSFIDVTRKKATTITSFETKEKKDLFILQNVTIQ